MTDDMNKEKSKKGLRRDLIDKFYTKPSVANDCIELVVKTIGISKDDIVIEPSAGNGSFIKGIQNLNCKNYFYDLKPEHLQITQQDYLLFDFESQVQKTIQSSKVIVIGNPPFGRQSSTAIKFIKKSCEYCDAICFILPKSFRKESLKRHFPLNFTLVKEIDLPENSFLVDDVDADVPCIFQIWNKSSQERQKPKKHIPIGSSIVKKDCNPDISFRRVGVNAGNFSQETENKSEQSHYFIKFEKSVNDDMNSLNDDMNSLNDDMNSLSFPTCDDTVGPKSISKNELICILNSLL